MVKRFLNRQQLTFIGGGYAFALFALYAWTYQAQPFGDFANRLIQNSVTALAALTAASILTVVVNYYQPGEPPRLIWLYFAIAIWSWAVAEVVWGAYNLMMGEVPDASAADIFWFSGYIFFTAALVSQYRLVLFERTRRPDWVAAGIWGLLILVTFSTIFLATGSLILDDFFVYLYPMADFAVGLAALILVITFHGGSLARPWLSLFAFVVSDSLFLWAVSNGVYDWGATSAGWGSFAVDTIYLVAYLFLSWGVFQQYLLLKYHAQDEPADLA